MESPRSNAKSKAQTHKKKMENNCPFSEKLLFSIKVKPPRGYNFKFKNSILYCIVVSTIILTFTITKHYCFSGIALFGCAVSFEVGLLQSVLLVSEKLTCIATA